MENNLNKIAKDLYGKIQVRFPEIKIGDENAEVLSKKIDIPKARFFEFAYKKGDISVGVITITLDEEDGIIIQISQDLHKNDLTNDDDFNKFIRSFRKFAKNRLLNFDVQNIGKSNLDKRDYQFQSKPKELPIMENKMFGTNKISYQKLGETKLIVKHSQSINPDISGGRSMHIGSIFIENADGERFKYPFKHLQGARALAEHIKNGGNPYDNVGKYITSLSEELNHLRKFKGFVSRQSQISESMGNVTNRVLDRINEVKKEISNFQKPKFYQEFVENFQEKSEIIIPEQVMNDWIDRLTIKTFNEELTQVFPYLYNIIDEHDLPVRELGVDDLLDEVISENKVSYKKELSPESKLELYLEGIVDNSEFNDTPESNKLNDLLAAKMTGGDIGATALKGLIKNPKIINLIRSIEFDDKDLEDAAIRDILKNYFLDKNPSEINELPNLYNTTPSDIGGEPMPEPAAEPAIPPEPAPAAPMPAPAPAAPMPAPAPAPVAPMAESANKTAKIKAKFIKLKEAGATLNTKINKNMTVLDVIKECGLTPMECGFDDETHQSNESGVNQLLKVISGFWDKLSSQFTIGGTRAKIKVRKAFEDGECPNATKEDVIKVLKFIDMKDPSSDNTQTHDVNPHGIEKSLPQIAIIASDDKETALLNNIQNMNEQPISENEIDIIKKFAGLTK